MKRLESSDANEFKDAGRADERPAAHGGRLQEASRRHRIPAAEFLDFSASINPARPEGLEGAIRAAALELSCYPEEQSAALRRSMADYLGVQAKEIVAGNGSIECIYWLARLLAPERVLIVEPTFSEYRRACMAAGASCDTFALDQEDGFVLDVRRLQPEGYDAVFVCNPNNPTGYYTPIEEMTLLWERCRESGAVLVVDEAFVDFVDTAGSMLEAGTREGLYVLRSFTKSHALAGARLGCLVAAQEEAEALLAIMPPWNVNIFAQAAGRAALGEHGFMHRSWRANRVARARLFDELCRLPGIEPLPSEANFILCRLTDRRSGAVAESLAAHGILVRDCRSFHGLEDRYLRVAVRSESDNVHLLAALAKCLRAEPED